MLAKTHHQRPLPSQILIANDGTGWRLLAAGTADDCTAALRRLKQEPAPRRVQFLVFAEVIGRGERFSDAEMSCKRLAGVEGESNDE